MFDNLAQRLEGRIITLEPLGPAHVDGIRAAAADDRIWTWMWTTDIDAWLEHTLGNEHLHPFAALKDGQVVGSTSYLIWEPQHLRVEIGNTWMHPSLWNTGASSDCGSSSSFDHAPFGQTATRAPAAPQPRTKDSERGSSL